MNDIYQHTNTLIKDSKKILLSLLFLGFSLTAFAQPVVDNSTVTGISNSGATLGGEITSDGGSSITERGIYWSTTASVTTGDTKELGAGTATGVFSDAVSGMGAKTRIYFKAFATNGSLTGLSTISDFYTIATTPGAATDFAPSNQTSSQIQLDWTKSTGTPQGYLIYTYQAPASSDPSTSDAATFPTSPTPLNITDGNTITTTIGGLDPNTQYSFTIIAYDWNGSNDETYSYAPITKIDGTSTIEATPIVTTPSVDFINSDGATLGGTITDDGGGGITERGIYWSTSNNVSTSDAKLVGAGTAVSAFSDAVSGMGAKTRIYFKAFATNGSLTGLSAISDFYTIATTPGAATDFAPSNQTSSQIQLDWTKSTGTPQGYLIYTYQAPASSDPSTSDAVTFPTSPTPLNITDGNTITTTIGGLDPNTQYSFTIIAYDWNGTNDETYSYAPITKIDGTSTIEATPIVTTPSVDFINSDGATLGGTITDDGGGAITERGIYWSTSNNVSTSDAKLVGAGTAVSAFSDAVSGMGAKTRIYFKAFATNGSLTGLSTISDFYTLGNDPGTIATFTSPSQSTTIDLSWAASTDATGYLIYQNTGSSAPTPTLTDGTAPTGSPIADVSLLTHTAISLSSFTEYSFTVIPYDKGAVDATYNYGAPKTLTSVFTTCDAPSVQASAPSLSNLQAGSMQINWTPGNGSAGTLIIARKDNAVNETPVSGTSYTANLDFAEGNGTDINSGNIVIYKGNSSPQTITGLEGSTDYHFAFYEFNTTDNCYLLAGAPTTSATSGTINSSSTITGGSAPLTLSSLANTTGGQVIAFNFTINDLGDDGADTDFTELRFTPGTGNEIGDWTQVIAGARLFNAATTPTASNEDHGTAVIDPAQIKIPNISVDHDDYLGDIHNNASRNFKLIIHLKSDLGALKSSIDGKHLVFELMASGVTIEPGTNSGMNPATSTNSNADAGTNNKVTVTASKIVYTTEPSTTATATIALAQQPILEARDANDNVDLDFVGAISVTTSNPSNLAPSNAPAAFNGGYSTFSGFNFQNVGTSTMNVAAGGLNVVNAASITVSASTAVAQTITGIAPSLLDSDGINKALLGFSLTTTGSTLNFTGATITTSSEPDGKIKNIKLYRSGDSSYGTSGDNTLIGATITTPTASSILITGISESINSSSDYFFIVADIESNVSASTSGNFQLSIANNSDISVSIGNMTGSSFNGTNYAFNDVTAPAAFTVGSVVTTGGRSIANYWNGTNAGVTVSVPIANDATLLSGSVQIQARVDANVFENIASALTIGSINTTKNVILSQANIEGITGFAQGKVIEFRAILSDFATLNTIGTKSATSLTVDTVAPTLFGTVRVYTNKGIVSSSNHEVIQIILSEDITLSHNSIPKFGGAYGTQGFSTDDNSVGDALYLNNGATNIVDNSLTDTRLLYFESSGNGSSTPAWAVSIATNLQYVQSGTAGIGNLIRDAAGNELVAFATTVSNGDLVKPTISPDVMTLFPRASSAEKIVFTLSEQLNLSSGTAVTGFSTSAGSVDPIASVYTDNAGAAPFTITLVSSVANTWDNATKVTYTGGGNIKDVADNELDPATVSSHGVILETDPPVINLVSIPNAIMNVGDIVPVTIAVNDDDLDFPILTSGTIGGYTLSNLLRTNSTTYTAQFTVIEGGNSYAAGVNIPVASLVLTDVAGNNSSTFTTPITQGSDLLDAVSPFVASITKASATNGWSTSNGTSTASVTYTVTFNEPVTGIDITDFTLTETGSITGTSAINASITGGATAYSVTVDSYLNTGTVRLNFVDNGSVFDTPGGNPVVGVGAIPDGGFSGDTYSIVLPQPSESISLASVITTPTNNSIQVKWTEPTLLPTHYLIIAKTTSGGVFPTVADGGYVADDLSLVGGVAAKNIPAVSSGAGISYTFNTGLMSGVGYSFEIYAYNLASDNSNDNIDFKTDGIPAFSETTITAAVSTLGAGSGATTIASINDTNTEFVSVFNFSVNDDDNNTDDLLYDDANFTFTSLTFTAAGSNQIPWDQAIGGVRITDGATGVQTELVGSGNLNITATQIIITNIANSSATDFGFITDDATKNYSLQIFLKPDMSGAANLPNTIDGLLFHASIDANSFGYDDTPSISSRLLAGQNSNSGATNNKVVVTATELNWTSPPQAAIGVLSTFSSPPLLTAQDENGNKALNFAAGVTSIANSGVITMNNKPTTFDIGDLTFTTINYADAGNGTLTVTAGGITSPASPIITVSYSNNTTIVRNLAFNEPATWSSTNTFFVQAGEFTITDDDAGAIVDDKVPTQITQIIVTAKSGANAITTDWSDIFEQAALATNGGGNPLIIVPNANIDANSITFSAIPAAINGSDIGFLADDASREFELWVDLKTPITGTVANIIDNKNFIFEVITTNVTTAAGSSTIAAAQNYSSDNASNVVNVSATELRFATQPSEAFINEIMTTVAVEATDIYGNRDIDYSGAVTITSSGTMAPTSVAASLTSGIGNTANITHTQLGNGLNLNVKDDLVAFSATGYNSSAFNIIPGAEESDITVSSITYETNIDYKANVSADVTNAHPKVFQFDINDGTSGGSTTDSDVLATNVTSLSFAVANHEVLQSIGLYNNSNVELLQVPAAANITFKLAAFGLTQTIPDDGTSTYHLRTTFNTSVIDNAQFTFTVSGALANDQGSSFESPTNGLQTSGTVATSSISGDDNRIEVTADRFIYTTAHPIGVSIDTPYGLLGVNNPVLEAHDGNGNLDADFDLAITFSNNSATLATSLNTTPGTVTGNFVGGVYTYDTNFEFDEPSLGNTDVIITIATAAGNNTDGDAYPILTKDTPGFEVSAAESSLIALDAANPNHTTFNYIDFDAPTGNFPGNSYDVLANFLILDEDMVPGFTSPPESNDLAPTILGGLDINVTNAENIKEIALYDGTTFYYGTDNGSGNYSFTGFTITANDLETGGGATGMASFSITASYSSALQNPASDDGEELKVTITKTTSAGGSKFNDSDDVGDNDAGGAFTPNATNIFNVLASTLSYVIQPSSIEGINIPTQEPQIHAIDANSALDLDFNIAVTVSVGVTVSNAPTSFGNINPGILDFPGFEYTQTGDGTITASAGTLTNYSSSPVDVIHSTVSNLDLGTGSTATNNGISTQTILPAGAINRAILGFSITAEQMTAAEPKLNEFTIRFGNPIAGVLENFRVVKSVDQDYETTGDNSNITLTLTITPGTDFVTVAGFSDALSSSTSDRNYFLVVDIDPNASFSSPPLTPQLVASGIPNLDVVLTSGSVISNVIGRPYTFNDINDPIIISKTPASGNNNFPATDLIEITFNEKVIPQPADSLMISIYRYIDDVFIGDYKLDKNLTINSTSFFFNTNGNLSGDTKYYVLIASGVENVSGFLDKSGNDFAGYTIKSDWSFTTSDDIDPIFDPNKLLAVTYIIDVGFDIKVALDEPGKVYYIVIDPDVSSETPLVQEIRAGVDFQTTTVLASGSIDILKGFEYHYGSVLNSTDFPTTGGNFKVWVTAEDIALPTANQMDEGTQLSVTDAFGTPPANITVLTTTEDICLGDAQTTLSPIYIVESSNGDFTGSGETINFVLSDEFLFDVSSTTPDIYGQGGDIVIDSWSYLNSSILQIIYSTSGTSNRDKIVLSNLEIKAAETNTIATTGTLVRLGGTGLTTAFPDLTLIAEFNTSQIPVITFDTDPSSSTIGNDEPTVALIPDQTNTEILLGNGTTLFTGSGIVGDTLFTAGLPLNTPQEILFTYKDDFGCAVSTSKSITIFDASNAIEGLNNIQCTDDIPDIIEFTGRAPQFLLIGLQVSIPIGEDPNAFDPIVVANSLTLNIDGHYVFDVALFNTATNYAKFAGQGGLVGTLLFTGQYQDQQNTTIIETLLQDVEIWIPPVSVITFLDEGAVNATDYCENDGGIRIDALPKPATGVSVGFFAIDNDPNHAALLDNGDGSAIIDPFIAGQLGYKEFDISYSFQNLSSGCDSTAVQTIRINPNPIAKFTNNPGCVDATFNFDNSSLFPNSDISNPNGDPDLGSVINEWNWNFDDIDNSAGVNANTSSDEMATHIFTDSRTYNVAFTVTSDRGCKSDPLVEAIVIGNNPATKFDFAQVAVGTPTVFTNTTNSNSTDTNVDSLAWTVNGVFIDGYGIADAEFSQAYNHIFTVAGLQEVILTAITDNNCAVSETLNFFTVPEYLLGDLAPYEENFDGVTNSPDQGGWVAWGINSSWGVGTSGGDRILIENNNNFWVTGVNAEHNNDEDSYVYSPVFNLTNLERPMIQLLKYTDLSATDGVVIEYTSVDLFGNSTSGILGDWKLLGGLESGEDWYNREKISNVGGFPNIARAGWSQADSLWRKAKHILDKPKSDAVNNNERVQFRISFQSGGNNVQGFNGFAFDNVSIGNRTRTVLLENFSSSQLDDDGKTLKENTAINVLKTSSPTLSVIQYHTNLNGTDPLSFSPDGDARALYYGISETPRVAIDGTSDAELTFTEWGIKEYNRRSLNISPLDVKTSVSNIGSNVEINTVITALKNIPENYIVHTVIVENKIIESPATPSGETEFNYVALKMLPSASGVKFKNALQVGSFETLTNTWAPSRAFDQSEFTIIVFVQDEVSKEIYQSEIITPTINVVTALDAELASNHVAVYPNPANERIILQLSEAVNKDTKVYVYDQLGQMIYSTNLNIGRDRIELDSKQWTPGIYYIQTELNDEPIQKRIMVQHH